MSLEDVKFKSNLYRYGLNRVNRFRVFIPLPEAVESFIRGAEESNGGILPEWAQQAIRIGSIALGGETYGERGLHFSCQTTELPGTQMALEDTRINGHTFHYTTGIERDTLNFNFMVSADLYEKVIFDKWLNLMVDEKTRRVAYFDDYVVDITIQALDIQDNVVYTLNMVDAFPVTVDALEMDRTSRDEYGQLSVSFQLKYTTNEELPTDETLGIPGNIGGLIDALTSGDLEQAAYSARMLLIQAQRGQFTGEAASLYEKINSVVEQTVGFSAVDLNKTFGGLSNMVNLSTGTSADEKSALNQLLTRI